MHKKTKNIIPADTKYFLDTYGRKTHFIPNGITKHNIREAKIIKEKYNLEKGSYILFLARIVPEKGLEYLIDAYNQIKTDKKLIIAGGGSHTDRYLKEIIEKVKNNKQIIMTGFVQGKELEELYSNCYLYCLPSDIEGMPLSLLEAMSFGCNCLVSDIEENKQVIGKYGFTFKKSDVHSLKKQLEYILNNDIKNDKNEIREYTLEKFNWDKVTKMNEEVYKKGKTQ